MLALSESEMRPLALRSLLAGLEKLEEDGVATRAEAGWSRSGSSFAS